MNENIDLTKILKDCPKGWKFWSPIFGEVEFVYNYRDKGFINISVWDGSEWSFASDATIFFGNIKSREVMLYPSKELHDWSKFTAPWYNLKKQDEDKKEINNFDVLPGLYKCIHRMFDGTPDGRLLFEIDNVYKCLSKHDRAEFEVSYGHSVYLEDPIVCKYFTPFESKDEQTSSQTNIGKNGQKSSDKTETRFKVGDWVVFVKSKSIYQVEKKENYKYTLRHISGNLLYLPFSNEKLIREWTINDAKDGDVLALSWWEDKNLWEKIIIFKKYHNEGVKGLYSMPCVEGYGKTFKNGKIAFLDEEVPYYSKTWTCNLHPATKEQRNLLFQKMKDAGYEWDGENKDFKKFRFDPGTLQPFDKVLVRDCECHKWTCDLFSHTVDTLCKFQCFGFPYNYCIPYNNDTKHLVGTTEEEPEYYKYWED